MMLNSLLLYVSERGIECDGNDLFWELFSGKASVTISDSVRVGFCVKNVSEEWGVNNYT